MEDQLLILRRMPEGLRTPLGAAGELTPSDSQKSNPKLYGPETTQQGT